MSGQTTDTAAVDQAVATARTEGFAAGKAEGLQEGAKGAVERINAILASDEGKARPKAALSAALKMSSVGVDEVKAFLGDLPEEKAETETGSNATGKNFQNQMNSGKEHDLGAPAGAKGGDQSEKDEAAERRKRVKAAAGLLRKDAA